MLTKRLRPLLIEAIVDAQLPAVLCRAHKAPSRPAPPPEGEVFVRDRVVHSSDGHKCPPHKATLKTESAK